MTVITIPSTGGKSDKAPLIGDGQGRPQPTPPYQPGLLESGGLAAKKPEKICVQGAAEHKQFMRRMIKTAVVLVAVLLSLFFVVDALCKSYVIDAHQKQMHLDAANHAAAVAAAAASVPCKSYTSYAAAESDMLSPLPSSQQSSGTKNLVISLVINPADGTVGKVQPIVINKSARFVHDFSVNVTGIIDLENQRCYVMPLIRSTVEPPESLYDMLIKMSSGYYSSDINNILRNFRLVTPALDDLSDYGMYISKDCADYPTFKLERDSPVTESP